MKRKAFIATLLPAALSFPAISRDLEESARDLRRPPYLRQGDMVGITSPGGYTSLEDIQPAIQQLQQWGYTVAIGQTIGKRDFTFGGTDEERAADLQQMLDNVHIKAILFARGGYGMVRIIDRLRFTRFVSHPKWLAGFSDITVMHTHISRQFNIATLHSKMCNSFPKDPALADPVQTASIESIGQCLAGKNMIYHAAVNPRNKKGRARGQLVGGNLKTIESLSGSKSDLLTSNRILFVEDTGEYLYSIDRMFWNLKRSGKLAKLKGLVIGGFKIKKDDEGEEFGKTIEDIVLEKLAEYSYPVCFDFPVGHQKNNYALRCGMIHQLEVGEQVELRSE